MLGNHWLQNRAWKCCGHLSADMTHQLFGNIWLSMASLVIFMQLRYLFHEVQRRVHRHKNYLRVVGNMEARRVTLMKWCSVHVWS
ncbi:E3 ubiquitin-protein ligase AMFR [Manis javanica]|nr:E3 ubiquitin-protein ligase AMFR [Manis javanica]